MDWTSIHRVVIYWGREDTSHAPITQMGPFYHVPLSLLHPLGGKHCCPHLQMKTLLSYSGGTAELEPQPCRHQMLCSGNSRAPENACRLPGCDATLASRGSFPEEARPIPSLTTSHG